MMRRDFVMYASLAAVLVAGLAVLFFVGPRFLSTPATGGEAGAAPASEARKIRARLFYVDPDGEHLTAVEQEVPSRSLHRHDDPLEGRLLGRAQRRRCALPRE